MLSTTNESLRTETVINKTVINPLVILNSGKLKWQGDFPLFQKFVRDLLNIEGKWTVPRSGCKQIKTEEITIRWYENQSVLLEGPLTERYRKILERIASISPDSESNLGVGNVEDSTPPHMPSFENINKFMLNFSSPCVDNPRSLTGEFSKTDELYGNSTINLSNDEITNQIALDCEGASLFSEKIILNDVVKRLDSLTQQFEKHRAESSIVLTELINVCEIRKASADTDQLVQENILLKEQNRALESDLAGLRSALTELNRKLTATENEKASLLTAIHQHYEYCSKQKDANVDALNNCLDKTKSVMTRTDSDITHSQSGMSDEPIIVLDNEGAGFIKVTKSRKTKTNIDKRPQTPTHTSKQNSILSGGNQLFNNEVTTLAAHSTIKDFHNTKGSNQANDPIPLILNTEAKKVNIEVNDVNDLISTNVSVSEISSQNNPNPTTRFNKSSYPNTQTPKHLVPCPFLRRKRHCVKGSKCDFSHSTNSHRPLQIGPSGSTPSFRVPSPYPGDFSHYINSQQPPQFDPRGFPSPFRELSPYPGPLFPPAIFHPLMNHLYAQPFIQPLPTLQPLMDIPTRTTKY